FSRDWSSDVCSSDLPSALDRESVRRLKGDFIVLGAGGKMGPSLARRIRRAADAEGVPRRVIAVSRFSSLALVDELNRDGIETITCDLLNRDEVAGLPACANVLFLSGRIFGSTDRPHLPCATVCWWTSRGKFLLVNLSI